MDRLPIKFEEKILKNHGIYWDEKKQHADSGIVWTTGGCYLKSFTAKVSNYEIIGIALEAIYNIDNTLEIQDNPVPYQFNSPAPETQLFTCTTQFIYGNGIIDVIFKAIEKIWN